jgi:hypothetical protein
VSRRRSRKLRGWSAFVPCSSGRTRTRKQARAKHVVAGFPLLSDAGSIPAASTISTFNNEIVAREWFGTFSRQWAPSHSRTVLSRMEQNLFPFIGAKVIREVTAPELLAVLRRIEARGSNETGRRVRQICSQVFRYAIATGRADNAPPPTFAELSRP